MREPSNLKAKLATQVNKVLMPKLRSLAVALLKEANADYRGGKLTGNTATSYTAGIYDKGILVDVINILEVASNQAPTYEMLSNNQGVVSIKRYDSGRWVSVDTSFFIKTDNGYGFDRAESLLASYNPKVTKGWSIVITTGTPYSSHLEETVGFNILADTFLSAEMISKQFLNS